MRILIAGSYGMGNTGDEAILAGILGPLRRRLPEARLCVVSGNPEATRALHGVEALPWDDWQAIHDTLAGSDLLILGGGGIFFDYTGFDPARLLESGAPDLAHYGSFPVLAWLLDKPLMIYAAGVGPLSTPEGREMVRLAFTVASRATVRDVESRDLLAEIGADVSRVEVTADPAFALSVVDPGGLEETRRPRIALTSRPWQLAGPQEEWERSFAGSIASFALARNAQILLVPFHVGSDEESLLRIREGLESEGMDAGDVVLFRGSASPSQVAGLLRACDLTVGLRLHSILLSMLAGTPAVALSYDPKVRSLARLAGHEELCLDLPGLSGLSALLEDAWDRREEIRRDFLRVSGELRILAEANADRIAEVRVRPEPDGETEAAFRRLASRSFRERLREIRERGALIERQWGELKQSQVWLDSIKQELEAARAERDTARTSVQRLREQRDLLLGERNDLARRLGEFEATLAYGMVSRFWGVMRQTFPEGSRRRGIYKVAKKILGKVIRTSSTSPAALELPPDADGQDPRGDLARFEDLVLERGAETVVAFFSATQLIESEGQRPTQLALELARRGIPVVFCYWRWWPNEWCAQDRMEEGIVQIPIDVVVARPEMLTGSFAGVASRIVLFEFPYPGLFETLAAANAAGWITVYDVLDDWEEFHRVGQAVWYDEPFERHLIRAADAVFPINEFLAERIRELGGEDLRVVGNGLKPGLEAISEPRPLERGEVTVGYFGYLAGAWFDWELIAEAARRRPSWRFYLIGYGGSPEGMTLTENVSLLGKKPQGELAAYAANWDAAIIPFKPDRLAAGADPIKTYEYLAMGLPVVATGVYPPSGGEAFVARAEGVEELLAELARAAAIKEGVEARRAFAASCTWGARLETMLSAIEQGEQRVAEKRALFGETA